jgi:AAA+ ATPase superfamily predicted ATPase
VKTFIEQIKDTLFFPQRMDGYSWLLARDKTLEDLQREKKLPVRHPIPYLYVILLYLVFILPFSVFLGIQTESVERAVASAFVLLGVGLLLGTIHATLGLMGVLTGIVLTTQNITMMSASPPSSTNWWLGAPVLLLPLPLYAQYLASPVSKPRLKFGRLLVALVLGSSTLYLASLLNGPLTTWHYYHTFFLLSFALAAPTIERNPTSTPAVELKADAVSWIGILASAGFFLLLIKSWSSIWTRSLSGVWATVILVIVLIVGGLSYLFLLMMTHVSIRKDPPSGQIPVFYAEKRWILFLFYAALQLAIDPPIAFLVALIGTLLYSLSLTSLNRNQDFVPNRAIIGAVTISALVWFYLAAGPAVNSTWLDFAGSFFLQPEYQAQGGLALVLPVFVLSIIGRSSLDAAWVTFFLLYIAFMEITNPDITASLVGLVGVVLVGLLVGFLRMVSQPLLSLAISRELRAIHSQSELSEDRLFLAADLIQIDGWPEPAKRLDLAVALIQRGLTDKHLHGNDADELLRKAKQAIVMTKFRPDLTVAELLKNDLTGAPKTVIDQLRLLRNAASSRTPLFQRRRIYLEVAHTLDSQLKESRLLKSELKTPAPGSATDLELGRRAGLITGYEEEVIGKMRDILIREIGSLQEENEQFEEALTTLARLLAVTRSQHSTEFGKDTPREILEQQFTALIRTATTVAASFESLDRFQHSFSSEDKTAYLTIRNAQSALQMDAIRLDLPAQRQAVNTYAIELSKLEHSTVKEVWKLNEKGSTIVAGPNPWYEIVSLMSQMIQTLQRLLEAQMEWAENQVIQMCAEADTIEKLAELSKKLETLNAFGEKFGSPLDETIRKLDDVSRDAASALSSKGYSQRLGVQDTLDRLNDLRGLLSTRFLNEASDILKPLDAMAKSIYESIFAKSDDKGMSFRNPYLTGNPIKEARAALFKGRLDLARKILLTLRSRATATFVLYGPRRMGKTSFLLQLPRLLPKPSFIPAYIDMQDGGAQSDAQFLYSLASALFRQTKKMLDNVEKPDLATFEKQPFIAFNEWLEALQPQLADKSIFFTIDEFEIIGKAIATGTLTEKVLDHLRHIMQHNENIILLFAGVQTIEALGPNAASYFISAYPLEISYLSREDAEELILRPDPSAGEMPAYDDDVVKEIIRISKCQPYLIQAICNEILVLANENSLPRISSRILDESISRVLSTSLYFKNLWDDSGKEGQSILQSIVVDPNTRIDPEKMAVIQELQKRHLICPAGDHQYAIEIPLVELWIRKQHFE